MSATVVGFKRVGRIYGQYEGRPLYHYPCTYFKGDCCHLSCRLAALRAAGHGEVADTLERNSKAWDWLQNWGRMVYDIPVREHGRMSPEQKRKDAHRRKAAAGIIRGMRAGGVDYGQACIGGAWVGALVRD